ncbi:MAG: carbohydrate kinase family protein [Candidatus Promineifilaceae bacterium]|nr:carbohydrate kinase family protein [Candidatus Promineifilaceae bacterium]
MDDYDVYAFGVIASSTLYLVEDRYPDRGGYAEIVKKYKNVGGEAANTSLVLSRLGLSVKLDGNWLNPDDDADFLSDLFSKYDVDISRLSFRTCQGPKEMLVVDSDSRTIFGTYAQLHEEQSWNVPERSDIAHARIVCLDSFFGEASRQVADYAKELDKPIVTVDCSFDSPLLSTADIAIISEEFLGYTYPGQSTASVTSQYLANSGGTVIFTFGHKEITFGSSDEGVKRITPYAITPLDTTGAGDSFRAGIIFGLLQNWLIEKAIRYASALAAIVCQSSPGVLNSPGHADVVAFLRDRESIEDWAWE